MQCFKCLNSCRFGAININSNFECLKINKVRPITIDKNNCNECNLCNNVCPIGGIENSAIDCIFCIVCSSKPHCVINSDEPSIGEIIFAIIELIKLSLRI